MNGVIASVQSKTMLKIQPTLGAAEVNVHVSQVSGYEEFDDSVDGVSLVGKSVTYNEQPVSDAVRQSQCGGISSVTGVVIS